MIVKNVDKSESNKAKFQVEVDSAAFEQAVNKTYQKKKGEIYIAGFRKGKAPRAVIEGMYGANVFYQDAIDDLGSEAFGFGVQDAGLNCVGSPALSDVNLSDDKVLTFTFSVELYPEVTLGQYKELELEKGKPEVTEEQLQAALDDVKKRNARMMSVEREAQMGDTANIDFDGYLNGERFDGGKAEGYSLELGSNSFVPGFEEQIVGMTVGQEKELNVTFPENYVENLAGKDVVFKVKLNGLTVAEYPELDDEFAKDVSEFDTIDEYKADMSRKMLEAAEKESGDRYRSDLMKLAADNMTVDVPEVMIEDKVTEFIRNYAANLGVKTNDIPREKLVEMLGIDDAAMSQSIRPAAEQQVKVDLLLEAVVKAENMEISDEDADAYIAKIAADYNAKPEDLLRYFGRDFLLEEYKKEKAADLIADTAKDVKGKKLPETKAAADGGEEQSAGKPAAKDTPEKTEGGEEKPAARKTARKAEESDEEKPAKKPSAKKAPAKAEDNAE